MTGQRYRTLVVDPPWRTHQPPALGRGTGFPKVGPNRALPYPTMTLAGIEAIPVADLAPADAHLYLWTINRYVEASYALVRRWGFTPSTLLTWCKEPMGMGTGGAFALTTEFCLFARRGRGAYESRHPSSWFRWPRGPHSAKPDAFYDLVERVSPGAYAELFARRARLGWSYPIGDQALGGETVSQSVPTVNQ